MSIKAKVHFLLILILCFVGLGGIEYWSISSFVPDKDPVDYAQPIGDGLLFPVGISLFLALFWRKYCYTVWSNNTTKTDVPDGAGIDEKLVSVNINIEPATLGTESDRVFFLGIVSAVFGVGGYLATVLFGISPVRMLLT